MGIRRTFWMAKERLLGAPPLAVPSPLRTNRDLYLAVAALVEQRSRTERSLESYLRALRSLARSDRESDAISLDRFFEFLREAFFTKGQSYDPAWTSSYDLKSPDEAGYPRWESYIQRQIVDLHEMQRGGQLKNKLRWFGIKTPRGSHWVNFEPCAFLECGLMGSLGGWQPGDSTGRTYVQGPVAVVAEDGQLEERMPWELDNPVVEIKAVSWADFRDFLANGQMYE